MFVFGSRKKRALEVVAHDTAETCKKLSDAMTQQLVQISSASNAAIRDEALLCSASMIMWAVCREHSAVKEPDRTHFLAQCLGEFCRLCEIADAAGFVEIADRRAAGYAEAWDAHEHASLMAAELLARNLGEPERDLGDARLAALTVLVAQRSTIARFVDDAFLGFVYRN